MSTGIGTTIVAAAIAALALAAGAPAKPTATPEYDTSAMEATTSRYLAMAELKIENDTSATTLPDGYQPQLQNGGSDAVVSGRDVPGASAQLRSDSSDVVSRYVDRNASTGAIGSGRETPDGFQPQLRGIEATASSTSGDGFDWQTFGIGLGSALLLAAIGGAALLATRTRGPVAHP